MHHECLPAVFADVDTRGTGSGLITYRASNAAIDIALANNYVPAGYGTASSVLVVTWPAVGYWSLHTDLLDT
jgi:hypothetical protein